MFLRAANEARLALCWFVTNLCRFVQEARLKLKMTHFRQFRIGSFFWKTITPFIVHFDLRKQGTVFLHVSSSLLFTETAALLIWGHNIVMISAYQPSRIYGQTVQPYTFYKNSSHENFIFFKTALKEFACVTYFRSHSSIQNKKNN